MKSDDENLEAPVIDAAFFAEILETDLANIVKKASSGQPLNKREREMIEEERTKREKKSSPDFKLQGEGPLTPLEKMTQRELADEWGMSLRTIKGWIAEGKKLGDLVPLHDPREMAAWFERVHSPRKCPDRLAAAAQRILSGSKVVAVQETQTFAPIERIEIAEEEKGMLAMLERYRIAEVTSHKKYMAALDAGDEAKATFYMSEWGKIGEKCRALEKAAPKALEELGIYVRRDDVQRELEPLHHAILKNYKQALRLQRKRLRAAETVDEWNRICDAIVDETAKMLCENNFAEPLELEAA